MSKRDLPGGTVHNPGGPGVPASTGRRDFANPTRLGTEPGAQGPYVDPTISDPTALSYAMGAAGRRRQAPIPRYQDAVAGGEDVPVPRLDSEVMGNAPMAEQARRQRPLPAPSFDVGSVAAEPALGSMPAPHGIVEGTEHLAPAPQPRVQAHSGPVSSAAGILPGDVLPEQATRDPSYQHGQGSMVAVNQPHLAMKYGVMRNNQFVPPPQLKAAAQPARRAGGAAEPTAKLSSQTLEGLEAIENFNKQRTSAENNTQREVEAEAAAGPAGGAGQTKSKFTDQEKRELLDELDDFDLSRVKSSMFKDLLNNDEQRKLIEARLKPLSLASLVIDGRVTQVVPIQPGVFEPEFQSYGGDEDLEVKRLLGEEAESSKPSERYLLDKYSIMGLTISLRGMNKRHLPDYRNAQGDFDEALFWKKYKLVSRLNFHMLGSLAVNWYWFDMRVRTLFKAEQLGNG